MSKKNSLLFVALLLLGSCGQKPLPLTILHTNDTHSQVEPLAPQVRNGGKAGYMRRLNYIDSQRAADSELLLLDAGDFFQGTPYFNFYDGEIEIDAMNRMRYDAVTLGNHEFDNGVEALAKALEKAEFQIVCANYDVTGTPLEKYVKPFAVFNRRGYRVGVFGLGVDPNGIISSSKFAPVLYLDPLPVASEVARHLKQVEKCDVVICLSHLGYELPVPGCSDVDIAKNSTAIDIIIGGHSHSLLENRKVANLNGDSVLIAQVGRSGAYIGKITVR